MSVEGHSDHSFEFVNLDLSKVPPNNVWMSPEDRAKSGKELVESFTKSELARNAIPQTKVSRANSAAGKAFSGAVRSFQQFEDSKAQVDGKTKSQLTPRQQQIYTKWKKHLNEELSVSVRTFHHLEDNFSSRFQKGVEEIKGYQKTLEKLSKPLFGWRKSTREDKSGEVHGKLTARVKELTEEFTRLDVLLDDKSKKLGEDIGGKAVNIGGTATLVGGTWKACQEQISFVDKLDQSLKQTNAAHKRCEKLCQSYSSTAKDAVKDQMKSLKEYARTLENTIRTCSSGRTEKLPTETLASVNNEVASLEEEIVKGLNTFGPTPAKGTRIATALGKSPSTQFSPREGQITKELLVGNYDFKGVMAARPADKAREINHIGNILGKRMEAIKQAPAGEKKNMIDSFGYLLTKIDASPELCKELFQNTSLKHFIKQYQPREALITPSLVKNAEMAKEIPSRISQWHLLEEVERVAVKTRESVAQEGQRIQAYLKSVAAPASATPTLTPQQTIRARLTEDIVSSERAFIKDLINYDEFIHALGREGIITREQGELLVVGEKGQKLEAFANSLPPGDGTDHRQRLGTLAAYANTKNMQEYTGVIKELLVAHPQKHKLLTSLKNNPKFKELETLFLGPGKTALDAIALPSKHLSEHINFLDGTTKQFSNDAEGNHLKEFVKSEHRLWNYEAYQINEAIEASKSRPPS